MTVTAVEATTPLAARDTVRVSDDAGNGSGFSAGRLRGATGTLEFFDDFSGWYVRGTDSDGDAVAGYVLAEYLVKVSEADILREQVNKLTTDLARAVEDAGTARNALALFKESVTVAASNVAEDDSDFIDPLNRLLSDLSLPALERDYEVTVNFNGSYTTTITATDEDAAEGSIDRASIAEYLEVDITLIDGYSTSVY